MQSMKELFDEFKTTKIFKKDQKITIGFAAFLRAHSIKYDGEARAMVRNFNQGLKDAAGTSSEKQTVETKDPIDGFNNPDVDATKNADADTGKDAGTKNADADTGKDDADTGKDDAGTKIVKKTNADTSKDDADKDAGTKIVKPYKPIFADPIRQKCYDNLVRTLSYVGNKGNPSLNGLRKINKAIDKFFYGIYPNVGGNITVTIEDNKL